MGVKSILQLTQNYFKEQTGDAPSPSRHLPINLSNQKNAPLTLITKKAVTPSLQETKENPRARSAKLRVVEKTDNCGRKK